MSTCRHVNGDPRLYQPTLFHGLGSITIGIGVEFGWPRSMGFHTGYCHVEAAHPAAEIIFEDGAQINNNAFIKSEGAGIRLGEQALVGSDVVIYDSDFHDLHPGRRRSGTPATAPVELGRNVFVGDRVIILKGVAIGENTVIGAGSVLVRSIPANVIAAGNPARVIRPL
jgi:maltose O-acetyltransferase